MGELGRRRFLATMAATVGVTAVAATAGITALSRDRVARGRPARGLVTYWGAKVDGKRHYDATIAAGSLYAVSCGGYSFTASDVGKTIIIGGGASATPNQAHITTIASISSGNAVLTTPAANPVTGAWIAWGTDDGAAWLQALTDTINTYDAQLTMPAGLSICGQAISLGPTNNIELFSLRGASVGTSEIICTASGGFLTLDVTGAYWGGVISQFDFRELTLTSAVAGATHALSVKATGGGSVNRRGYNAEHIVCQGFDYSKGAGYWDKPIEAIGLFLPYLSDVIAVGLVPNSASGDWSDTSLHFIPTLGINLNESFAPELAHVQIVGYKRGLQMIASNGSQGGSLSEMSIAACREGLYWQNNGGQQPQLTISGGNWGANRDYNICLNTRAWSIISHGLSFGSESSRVQSSTLATAVTTASSPTTLTLASTSGFAEVGAVQIALEWFTYNNLATGMDGTTLHNVVRSQFGTGDPGSDYAVGTRVNAATADIVLIDTLGTRIDNQIFSPDLSANRIAVLLHSGNTNCSVSNTYADTKGVGIGVAISNDSIGTVTSNNTCAPGTIPVLSRTNALAGPR